MLTYDGLNPSLQQCDSAKITPAKSLWMLSHWGKPHVWHTYISEAGSTAMLTRLVRHITDTLLFFIFTFAKFKLQWLSHLHCTQKVQRSIRSATSKLHFLQPRSSQGRLVLRFLDHAQLDIHTRYDSSERVISPSQRPLRTQHTTNKRYACPCPQR
jgi:hypothetical protein